MKKELTCIGCPMGCRLTATVLDDGKITGVGSHTELLAGDLEYQEIYNSQISGKDGE